MGTTLWSLQGFHASSSSAHLVQGYPGIGEGSRRSRANRARAHRVHLRAASRMSQFPVSARYRGRVVSSVPQRSRARPDIALAQELVLGAGPQATASLTLSAANLEPRPADSPVEARSTEWEDSLTVNYILEALPPGARAKIVLRGGATRRSTTGSSEKAI